MTAYEPPGPTLRQRAQTAQDRIGWANMVESPRGDTEFSSGTLDLARLVTDLAREVERLQAEVEALKAAVRGETTGR